MHLNHGIDRDGGSGRLPVGFRIIKSDRKGKRGRGSGLPICPAAALAALFLLAALVCTSLYAGNPEKQAGRFLKKLYTINQYQGVDEAVVDEFPGIYRKKFGSRMTAAGLQASMNLKLPYSLLQRERPVDRTYAQVTLLKEKPGKDSRVKEYNYEILVETHLIREDEAVQPVLKEVYSGGVRVKKSGWFRWKLDDITSGRKSSV